MNIAVDFGNTMAKVGIFDGEKFITRHFFNSPEALQAFVTVQQAENIIVSSVSFPAEQILAWSSAPGKKIAMSASLPLPINLLYLTPLTLGVDRIAGACGALQLYPSQSCLVIDAGTCINYEYVDADANYHGGAISPGIAMRFEAMHSLTARLPLSVPVDPAPLTGNNTETCLQSGVVNGAKAEISGIIGQYVAMDPGIKVVLCGGDAHFFEKLPGQTVNVVPELVLVGLNRILNHIMKLK